MIQAVIVVVAWWLAANAFVVALASGCWLWREGRERFVAWLDESARRIS